MWRPACARRGPSSIPASSEPRSPRPTATIASGPPNLTGPATVASLRDMPRPHGIPDAQWRDWVWQMQERVRSAKDLERYINPTEDERQAIEALAERFRFVITPYYASLMDPDDPACPIRKQVVPRTVELDDPAGVADPLDE